MKLVNMNYFDNLKIDYESESLTNRLQDLKLHDIIKNKYKSIKAGWFKINLGTFIAVTATIVICVVIVLCKQDTLQSKLILIDLSDRIALGYENLKNQVDTFNKYNIPVLKSFHTSEIFLLHNYMLKGAEKMGENIFTHSQKLSDDFINKSIFTDNIFYIFQTIFLIGVYCIS